MSLKVATLKTLKNEVLPPRIKHLFSVWHYLNMHQEYLSENEKWRDRYTAILNVLDKDNRIQAGNDKAMALLTISNNRKGRPKRK